MCSRVLTFTEHFTNCPVDMAAATVTQTAQTHTAAAATAMVAAAHRAVHTAVATEEAEVTECPT